MKHVHAVVWKEGKWFVARALEVEIASQGRTQKTALENLKEALKLYFEDQSRIELTTIRQPELQEVAMGTFSSILRQADMEREQFEKFVK